ncbi:hypothetical protein AAC387_Pa08g1056 [Persea americana]
MVRDSMELAKRCEKCQRHASYIHCPLEPLHLTIPYRPFNMWEIDVIKPITPPSSKGHRFILATTDYFSKWAKAVPRTEGDHLYRFREEAFGV